MTGASLTQPGNPITDKPGPPTTKDNAFAADVMSLRAYLLEQPEVAQRLQALVDLKPGGHVSQWAAQDGLRYYLELGRLHADLEHVWSEAEIDRLVDGDRVGFALCAGRAGRGRRRTPDFVRLVGRALAGRAAGMSASRADEAAADADAGVVTTEAVAIYRKRLRDSLT
jgi:hypothetical protein